MDANFATFALGCGIVACSVALKVPQISRIVSNGSAEGVSLTSLLLESVCCAVGASRGLVHGLEFKDLEHVLVAAQLVPLVLLVAYYQRKLGSGLCQLVAIAALGVALSRGAVAPGVHETLLSATTLISIGGQLPQISINCERKSTGELAFHTYALAMGGCAARTALSALAGRGGARAKLGQHALATVLNLVVMAQIFRYRHKVTLKRR